jgi:hypothetical protein
MASALRSSTPRALIVRGLPLLTAALLFSAWWLSLIVLADTPIVKVTPTKLVIFVSVVVLIVLRGWRYVAAYDRPIIMLTAAYLGWLVVAAGQRGSVPDLKLAVGYAVMFGGAWLLAYLSTRIRPGGSARALLIAIIIGLALTAVGVALERFTYPLPGQPDPLEAVWRFVRPPIEYPDAASGFSTVPVHFSSGDLAVPRTASWFAHANYLALFGVLACAVTATLLAAALRRAAYRRACAAALAVLVSSICVAWTYSRAGLLGLLLVAIAVGIVSAVRFKALRISARGVVSAAPLLVVLASLAATLMLDDVGLRRFGPLVPGAPEPPLGEPSGPTVEGAAERSGSLRLEMQLAAAGLVGASPRDVILGPGLTAYDRAVHDPSDDWFVKDATGIVDPNSVWLTLAISGGAIGVALLATTLLATWWRVFRSSRFARDGSPMIVVATLAAWLPTWAVVQAVGTNPFNTSEAVILGTMLGAATAHSGIVLADHRAARMGEAGFQ